MQSPSKRLWDWCLENVQPQQPKIGQFATPRICETEKGGIPFAVRVAGCCEPRRGSFATPPLIPATKSQANPADLELYFSLCRLPPKPPDFRLEPVGRVVSPPFRQSRHTGRQVGLQAVLVFLYRFAVQPFEAALGIGQSTLCYETVENSDHIRFF